MRSNFQLMKSLAEYTRMDPKKRVQRLRDFSNRLLTTEASRNQFQAFHTELKPELVQLEGRQLPQETMVFGNEKTAVNDDRVDWTNPMKINQMFQNEALTRWGIIFPKRCEPDTRNFLKLLFEVAKGMQYEMKEPKMIEIGDDRIGSYSSQLESFIQKDPKFVLIVLPNNSADRYSAVKKISCVDHAVPVQVVVLKTMQPKKGNMGGVKSIATKVLIQINAKLSGAPWTIKFPMAGVMTIGFDVSRDAVTKKSYGAFVATMDLKKRIQFFSSVAPHSSGEECSSHINVHVRKALKTYCEVNGCLPERILMYRDGVSDGEIHYIHNGEVKVLERTLKEVYAESGEGITPKFCFIVVSKRINTRFFINKPSGLDNPGSGVVVDSTVTLPERYDFYLISQSVRQGTVSPTSYNVIADTFGLTSDRLQILTYKLTHLYYNWSGTTR
jgi:aubergine-like protein